MKLGSLAELCMQTKINLAAFLGQKLHMLATAHQFTVKFLHLFMPMCLTGFATYVTIIIFI